MFSLEVDLRLRLKKQLFDLQRTMNHEGFTVFRSNYRSAKMFEAWTAHESALAYAGKAKLFERFSDPFEGLD